MVERTGARAAPDALLLIVLGHAPAHGAAGRRGREGRYGGANRARLEVRAAGECELAAKRLEEYLQDSLEALLDASRGERP